MSDLPPLPPPRSVDNIEKGTTTPEISKLPSLETLITNREDGKVELLRDYCKDKLGFAFTSYRKWTVLIVIFIVQMSMNFNASVYGNAVPGLMEEFGSSSRQAKYGQMAFLVAYGFGSEFWAPWSEQYGRWRVMQLSLFFVNLFQIPCALAPNLGTIIAFRVLGGLSSAGGSVTLGMVADLYDIEHHQYGLNFIVLSSCSGSAIGPIIGAFVQRQMSWHWVFWIQLIFGAAVQLMHFCLVPETRETSLIDREARKLRKADPGKHGLIYGPGELGPKLDMKQVVTIWVRPFRMFVTDQIVFFLSLLSGFSDALIFSFIDSFHDVFEQWNFDTIQLGLTFVPIIIGYLLCFLSFIVVIRRHRGIHSKDPSKVTPETRMWWLLYLAPLLPVGLLGFTLTSSFGPPLIHWMGPLTFALFIGIANYAIYMATVDYMMRAYGEYSASATGGNALARDVLAGFAALYSEPMYDNLGKGRMRLFWPSMILTILGSLITIPVYIIYRYGPAIRERSSFARSLAVQREEAATASRNGSVVNLAVASRVRDRGMNKDQAYHTPADPKLFGMENIHVQQVSARQY